MARFLDRIHRARMVSLHLRPRPIHSTREHLRMVALLRKGDVPAFFLLCWLEDAIVVPVIDRLRGNPGRRDPRVSKLQIK